MHNPLPSNYNKDLYRSILNSMNEGVIIIDNSNRILEINKSGEDITGYSFSEIRNKNPKIFSYFNTNNDIYLDIQKQLETKGFWIGELDNRHKNGNIYSITIKIQKYYNTESKKINYFGVFSDLSSQNNMNDDLLH